MDLSWAFIFIAQHNKEDSVFANFGLFLLFICRYCSVDAKIILHELNMVIKTPNISKLEDKHLQIQVKKYIYSVLFTFILWRYSDTEWQEESVARGDRGPSSTSGHRFISPNSSFWGPTALVLGRTSGSHLSAARICKQGDLHWFLLFCAATWSSWLHV